VDQVAIVGLGAGSMACYVTPPQQMTYYEIDPAVERIAEHSQYFTFLRDCGPNVQIVLGDARLSLQAAPDHHYGLIIIDAFSGDAIPTHLLTREALQLYLSKLAPNGLIVFHISNNYLDLEPVVANLAEDAGLAGLIQYDTDLSKRKVEEGTSPSIWAVVARSPQDLARLASDQKWRSLRSKEGTKLWTDDFSSLISIVKWK
jgi:spermidine synthase